MPLNQPPEIAAIQAALSDPFDPKEVKFKPQMVKNNRALAMAYIDARLIQDRLDDVLGVANWQDKYDFLPDGSVVCRLCLKFGDRWITKIDVGSPSEQPDSGDRVKAAVSDALKRAAVKFGIGRYLYRLPAQWVDYDPVKKQLVQIPQMPFAGQPRAKAQQKPATSPPPKQASQQPTAAPEPTIDQLRSQIFAEINRTGRAPADGWAMAMAWLSSRYPTEAVKYTPKTRALDIELPRLKELLANLKTHPSAQGAA